MNLLIGRLWWFWCHYHWRWKCYFSWYRWRRCINKILFLFWIFIVWIWIRATFINYVIWDIVRLEPIRASTSLFFYLLIKLLYLFFLFKFVRLKNFKNFLNVESIIKNVIASIMLNFWIFWKIEFFIDDCTLRCEGGEPHFLVYFLNKSD